MPSPVHRERLLPYVLKLDSRQPDAIDTVVIHCTELPDLETAWQYGERIMHPASGTGNSGHYYIDRDGRIEQWVPLDRAAHHVKDHNSNTIGIELVNLGRYPDWFDSNKQRMSEPYPDAQIDALQSLLGFLHTTLPGLRWITGHEDMDTAMVAASDNPDLEVRRKLDPGIMFPWQRLLQHTDLERRV